MIFQFWFPTLASGVAGYLSWKNANFAITLCGSANESCVSMPWPEKCKRIHWPIDDPITLEDYRKARDEIKERIEEFLTSTEFH